jgi:hypothetical protein
MCNTPWIRILNDGLELGPISPKAPYRGLVRAQPRSVTVANHETDQHAIRKTSLALRL